MIETESIYRELHLQHHGEPAAQLRKLADWIEAHGLTPNELIAAKATQYDLDIQVTQQAARRLFPGRKVTLDADGLCFFREEGICFSFITKKNTGPETVTL